MLDRNTPATSTRPEGRVTPQNGTRKGLRPSRKRLKPLVENTKRLRRIRRDKHAPWLGWGPRAEAPVLCWVAGVFPRPKITSEVHAKRLKEREATRKRPRVEFQACNVLTGI